MPPRPERLILIHGAWAGPWVWDALIPELLDCGWRAKALALPGDGSHRIPVGSATAADFHASLASAIHAEPGPVALVGHSGGGMLVTAGADAHPEKVSHGIWIAGMLIADGRSFDDIQSEVAGPEGSIGVTPFVEMSPDGLISTVSQQTACEFFFHDAGTRVAADAAAKLTPQPTSGRRLPTKAGPKFEQMQKLYVLAEYDRSVLPAAQRMMATSVPNVTLASIATGHAPQLVAPVELAKILSDWIGSTSDNSEET